MLSIGGGNVHVSKRDGAERNSGSGVCSGCANFLTRSSLDVNSALSFLQERLQQYKVVEMKLLAQQRDLQATTILQKSFENAKASLEILVADIQVLRDQVTTTQVTIARVYNWDAHQRRLC